MAVHPHLKLEAPDDYRVNAASYPVYRLSSAFDPSQKTINSTMPIILPQDAWVVRYRNGEHLLIFSSTYQERLCHALSSDKTSGFKVMFGRCVSEHYFFHIWILAGGRVDGGWKAIANPRVVLLESDRRTRMTPENEPQFASGWAGVSFQAESK